MSKTIQINSKLAERLKAYSLAAGALAAAGTNADAAIVYTDINPDFNGGLNDQYFLDLNNDAIDDFRIFHNGYYTLRIEPLEASNSVLGSGGSLYAYPYALGQSNMISAAQSSWIDNGYAGGNQSMFYGSYCTFGNWCNQTDKYLGLRFTVGANTYYGWARLTVNAATNSWVIKDYAYNDVAGAPILAGQTAIIVAASGAQNVIGVDTADNSNGLDLEVSFDAGQDEATINEYRIMVVKDALSGTFNLDSAQAVLPANYYPVTPNLSATYTQSLGATGTDVDGDPIVNGQPYKIFVHSVADGTNATVDSLSLPSTAVTLFIEGSPASNVMAADIANNSNGTDLEVSFDAANDESVVGEYRIMVVKTAQAPLFDIVAAQLVPAANYTSVAPNASPSYLEVLATTARDVTGAPITNGQPYTVFVMSVADGVNSNQDTLSDASSSVILSIPLTPATGVNALDVADNNDGTDLEVIFDKGANENTIGQYRIMAVKAANATGFNLAAAEAVPATRFKSITPNGSFIYINTFDAGSVDVDGDPITIDQPYRVFVLNMADGSSAITNVLSNQSNEVTLNIRVNQAVEIAAADTADNLDASDIQVTFERADQEFEIQEYRVMVAKDGATLSAIQAAAVPAASYVSVEADSSESYALTLTAGLTDIDGDAIEQKVAYQVHILSMSNGSDANLDTVAVSNSFTLRDVLSVGEIQAESIKLLTRNNAIEISGMLSSGEKSIEVFDLTGRMVKKEQTNSDRTLIEMSGQPAGVYLIRLNQNGTTSTFKVPLQ